MKSLCMVWRALVRSVLCCVVLVLAGAQVGWAATYTYVSGSIHLTTSWSPVPPNFTTPGDVFVINIAATLTGTLTIAGDNATLTRTRLTVSNGASLTIAAGATLNLQTEGTLDVFGTVNNNGIINAGVGADNRGFIQVSSGGVLNNTYNINILGVRLDTLSQLSSAGSVSNSGRITVGNASVQGAIKGEVANTFTSIGSGAISINRGIIVVCANNAFSGNAVSYTTANVTALRYTSPDSNLATIMASSVEFPSSLSLVQLDIQKSSTNGPVTLTLDNTKTLSGVDPAIRCDAVSTLNMNNQSLTVEWGRVLIDGTITNSANSNFTFGSNLLPPADTVRLKFDGTQTIQSLTFNRPGPLILASPLTVSNTLTLTNGKIHTTSNTLTVSNTNVNAIMGGSPTSYVTGTLSRAMSPNISIDGTSYAFPVGDANNYRPLTLQNIRTGVGTPSAAVSLPTGTPAPGTGLVAPFADANRIWQVTATGPFTSSGLLLSNLPTPLAGTARIGTGAAATGAYNAVPSTPSGTTITSVGQITGGFGTTNQFVAIGTDAVITYDWSGGFGTSWTTPANWTPNRTTPAPTDILRFPIAVTIENIPTETIGQLRVTASGAVTLVPAAAGNVLTITGGTGDDVSVPAGSFLVLTRDNVSNDMNISLNSGTNLNVAGALALRGYVGGAGDVNITGEIHVANPQGLNGTSLATGAIRASGTVTYSPSKIVFIGGTNLSTGFNAQGARPAVSVVPVLQVNDNAVANLDRSITVNSLQISAAASQFAIGANTLTLNDAAIVAGASITGSVASNLVLTRTSAYSSALAFTIGGQTLQNLTLNGVGLQATLGSPLTVTGAATFTNGQLISASSNELILPASTAVTASAAGYVRGTVVRSFVTSAGPLLYPVGTATNYRPFELLNITAGGTVNLRGEVQDAGATMSGTGITGIQPRNWRLEVLSGTLTQAQVRLTESGLTGTSSIGRSPLTQAGPYSGAGNNAIGASITSNMLTGWAIPEFFAIGTFMEAPTTFYYGSGDPAIPANWRSNPGGMTGTPATDFTTAFNTYIIETGKTATLTAAGLTLGMGTNFLLSNGATLNLGAGNLAINGLVDFFGSIGGNATSTLSIGGTGNIGGILAFSTPNLGGLIMNRAGFTLTFTGGLSVGGTGLNLLAGSVAMLSASSITLSAPSSIAAGATLEGTVFVSNTTLSNAGNLRIPAGDMLHLSGTATVTGSPVNYLAATSLLLYNLTVNRGTTDVEFPPAIAGNVTVAGAFTLLLNNSKTVANVFSVRSGAIVDIGANNTLTLNGNIITNAVGTGFFSGGADRSLTIGGSSIFSGNLTFSGTNQLQNFTLNRASTTIPLGSNLDISGNLTLTNGILNANGNVVNITNTAVSAIPSFSATSYVQGSLSRAMLPNIAADGTSYDFPIGDASAYRPLRLQNIRTGAGTPSVTASLVAGTPSAGTGLTTPFADANRTWFVNALGTFTSSELVLSNLPTLAATARLGTGTAAVGAYNRITSTPSGTSISSVGQITGGFGTTNRFVAIGTNVAATYTWSGGTMGDWSITTNWTPNRTAPQPDDRLEILNPATLTINNIPNETIGQLICGGGGNKTLNGAGTTLTITGGTGDDFTSGAATTTSLGNMSLSLNAGTNLVVPVNSSLGLSLSNTISGVGDVTIDGGFTTPHPEGLNGTSAATGAIRATGTVSYGTQMRLRTSSPNIRLSAQSTKPAVNTVLDFQCDDNVALDKSLTVTGALTLAGATSRINIGANTLTINDFSNLPMPLAGAIIGSAASNLTITKTSPLTSPLNFQVGAQTLNNLSLINPNGSANVMSDLTITGLLSLVHSSNFFGFSNLTLNDFSGLGVFGGGISLTITKNGTVTSPLNPTVAISTFTLNGVNLECTLGSTQLIGTSLQLLNGVVNTSPTATFTLAPTATIMGGSATSFVRGPLTRGMTANIAADGTNYTFPVGDAGGYRPLNLNNVRTGAMSPAVRVTPAQTGATTPGMGTGITTPFAEGGRNWRIEQLSGNFNSATVELFANGLTADSRAARSTAQAGPYDRAGQTGGVASVLSDAGQTPGFFAIGTRALQTVTWTGGGMAGNWNDPVNWGGGPVPNGVDYEAKFTGGVITITSGLPMSLGQLVVEGGASVILQQASTLTLTAGGQALLVRGNSNLSLTGTNLALQQATATGSIEAGSTLSLATSGITLGANGNLAIAGTLQRASGTLTGGGTTPVTFASGSTLRYSGAGNVTTGVEFPATLPSGVTLVVQKAAATDVVTLSGGNKTVQAVQMQQGRLAIPAGTTLVIGQNSTIAMGSGFDIGAMGVLEMNAATLANNNPTVGATGGINTQADARLRLRDAASVTTNPVFYAAASSTLEFAGAAAKTTNLQELPATMAGTVELNNGGGITLDAMPRTIQGGLTLTNGILTTPAALTLDQTITTLSPGSPTAHVRTSGTGTFGRILPPSLSMSATPYLYPVGDASGYRPFTLTNVSTGVMPVSTAVSTFPSGATSVGAGLVLPFVEMGRNWKFDVLTGTLSNAQITLQTASALNPALNRVGISASGQAGAYDRTGGTVAGLTITSDNVSFPAAPVTRHFAIANLATTFYYISGDPALPASWRTDAAGTGGTPLASDFTTAGRTFIIPTPRTATLASPLTFDAGVNFTMEVGTTLNGGNQVLTLSGTSSIAGTLNLDGTSTLVANGTPVIQNGGTVRLVGNLAAITMNPPLYFAGATLVYDNRTATAGIELPAMMPGNVQIGGGMGVSTITMPTSRTFQGTFTLQGASQLAMTGMFTEAKFSAAVNLGTGTIAGNGSSRITFDQSGAVTGLLNLVPPTGVEILNMQRPATITLGSSAEIKNLVLSSGILDARTNNVTVRVTENLTPVAGVVDGNLEIQLPANISANGRAQSFPITQGGVARTLTLQDIRTGATAPIVRVCFDSTGAANAQAGGGLASVQPANWRVEVVSGDFQSAIIGLNEANYTATNRIGTSIMQAGGYVRISSGAAQTTSRQTFSPMTLSRFFAIGITSTNPVRYTFRPGATDPTNPANWLDSLGRTVANLDFITPNSEFVIPAGMPVGQPVRLGADWRLGDSVSLVVKAGATLVVPDTRTLTLGTGGMLVEAGTAETMNRGGTVQLEGLGLITGGSSVYAGTTATLIYTNSLSTKTATDSEFPMNFGGSLVVNRGGGLIIPQSRTIAGTLALENGIVIVPSPNALTLSNPQPASLQRGSASAFVAGTLQRSLLPNLRGDSAFAYSFPVGAVSNAANGSMHRFLPFTLIAPQTGTIAPQVLVRGAADNPNGRPQAGLTALSQTEFWEVQIQNGPVSAIAQLGGVNFSSAKVVATSATRTGEYVSARGTGAAPTLRSERIGLQGMTFFTTADGQLPIVQSVLPALAFVGNRIDINGSNLQGVQAIEFGGGVRTVPLSANQSQIAVNVPQGAQSGVLRLISPVGIVTATENFIIRTLGAEPTISTIQPPEASPGQRITIRGTNLSMARVEFRAMPPAGSTQATIPVTAMIVVNSTTEIIALVPQTATSGNIVITTPSGSITSATVFRIVPLNTMPQDTMRGTTAVLRTPVITGFSPNVADSGQTITIRGANLTSTNGNTTVLLGGVIAPVLSSNDSTLTVRIPTNSASGLVTVRTPAGEITTQTPFTTRQDSLRSAQTLLPQITGLQPTSAQVGDTVRVLGRNLSQVSGVRIGAGAAVFRIVSATEIVAIVPADASSGGIVLTHPAGSFASPMSVTFMLILPQQPMTLALPTITGFSRDTVRVGDTLTVRGTNLTALDVMQFSHGLIYTMNVQTVISSSATALVLVVPRPPDTTFMRLYTFFVRNAVGATTANFGTRALWIIPTRPAPVPPVVVDSARLRDSLALVSFFETTSGSAWRNRAGWGTSAPMSQWFGLTLENNRVTRIILPNNNLRSSGIPPALERCTALRVLNLSDNQIGDNTGLVRLLGLVNLEELQLADCRISGTLDAVRPASGGQPQRTLCAMTRLRMLNLSGNGFTGGLPPCLGALTALQELNLAGNRLEGTIPAEFGRQTLLAQASQSAIILASEKKSSSQLTALTALQSLDLSGNQLSGAVPPEIAALTALRTLRLGQNRLTSLPNLSALRGLDTLTLGGNMLRFGDIQQFAQNAPRNFDYAPQDSITPAFVSTTASVGGVFTLRAIGTSAGAAVEWLKNGVSLGAPRFVAQSGEVLSIPGLRASDAGAYSFRVTHPQLPALTLASRPVVLTVQQTPMMPDDGTNTLLLLAPQTVYPPNLSRDVARRPGLRWTSVAGALRYEVEIRQSGAGTASLPLERLATQTDTAQRTTRQFEPESRLEWRVRAIIARGTSLLTDTTAWSPVSVFTTVPRNVALGVSTINFGKVLIDEVVTGEVAITNTGESAVQLDDIAVIAGGNEFGVEEEDIVRNVRLQPGDFVSVEVKYQPSDTALRRAGLRVRYTANGVATSLLASETLEGRGVPLEVRPLDFGEVLVGRTRLASAQVVNRSVYDLAIDSLVIRANGAASEGVFAVERGALVQSGRLFLGRGDTTTILVRCRAPRVGSFAATLRLASARVDTLEVPILARSRERLPTDIIAKIGLRAEPATAKPGDTVRLRLFLAEGSSDSLFAKQDVRPNFSARVRFDKYVLTLLNEQGGKARSIINTDPRNRVWRYEIKAKAVPPPRTEDFLAEQTVPCLALNADVEETPLVVEDFEWGDMRTGRKYWFEAADAGRFRLSLPRANGSLRRFAVDTVSGAPRNLALSAIAPNPAREAVDVAFSLKTSAPVSVSVIDATGRKVASVLDWTAKEAGEHRLQHRLSFLPSGAYLLVVETPTERIAERLEVVR